MALDPTDFDTTVGGVNANSYVSSDDADTYHENRGNTAWAAATDAAKEAVLLKATEFLDARFRSLWKGRRTSQTQALAWPRKYVLNEDRYRVASDTLPVEVMRACCEAALTELVSPGTLFPQLDREERSVTVGPISITYETGVEMRATLTACRDILTGLLLFNGGMSGFLQRA